MRAACVAAAALMGLLYYVYSKPGCGHHREFFSEPRNEVRAKCRRAAAQGAPRVVLLTGAAGFVGFHTALELRRRGDVVLGVDNFNTYYDVNLKRARAAKLPSPQLRCR